MRYMEKDNYEIIIKPGKRFIHYWKEILDYRELFYILAWRDIAVRYKQTVLGSVWAVLRPLLTMLVFTVVFGRIAKLPSSGAPYPLMVFAGMLPWQFFASSLSESSNSLLVNAPMLTKVYFPRLIMPASAVIASFVDFIISFVILVFMMFWYNYIPGIRILILPILMILTTITALGAGFLFAALNVKYRDFRYVIPFVVQLGLYISPVGFSSDIISEKWRLLYSLNPMVGIIDGFRWSILGANSYIFWPGFLLSVIISLLIFLLGLWYFRKSEKQFADII
jgi:lipopolysaccharide transport system permease protein